MLTTQRLWRWVNEPRYRSIYKFSVLLAIDEPIEKGVSILTTCMSCEIGWRLDVPDLAFQISTPSPHGTQLSQRKQRFR
jgi:hypothetical protein